MPPRPGGPPPIDHAARLRAQFLAWRPVLPIRAVPAVRIVPARVGENLIAHSPTTLQIANQRRSVPMEIDVPFDPAALGLKEIGNLASWTVSSSKPGCGVEALRDEDTNLFWQSVYPYEASV